MMERLRKGYPLRLEIIPLALLAFTVYWVVTSYPTLPDQVPTHFDLQGLPDRWGSKNEVLIFPILGAVLYVFFTAIVALFAVVKDPRSLINLPRKMKDAITDTQAEKLRLFFMRTLFALKVLMQGLMAFTAYATIEVAFGRSAGMGVFSLLFAAAILIVAGLMLWKSLRMAWGKE